MAGDAHEKVETRLQGAARYTRARRQLIDALLRAGRPTTAEEIFGAEPDLPLSSIYRNLAMFEETGVVHRLMGAGEHARYELAEAILGHHHHLSCSSCGAMTDIELPARLEQQLDRSSDSIAAEHGFQLVSHRLDLVGLCDACAHP